MFSPPASENRKIKAPGGGHISEGATAFPRKLQIFSAHCE